MDTTVLTSNPLFEKNLILENLLWSGVFFCWTIFVTAVILVWGRNPSNASSSLFAPVRGCAFWTYLRSMLNQAIIYPACILSGLSLWHSGINEGFWLHRAGGLYHDDANDLFCLRLFMYFFFGYLAGDVLNSFDNVLFAIHHVVCMLGIQIGLQAPEGGVPIAVGIFSFEFGSLAFNLWCIDSLVQTLPSWRPFWPRSKIVKAVYYGVFTASNVFGGYCLALSVVKNCATGHWSFGAFFGIVGFGLLLLRQRDCVASMKSGPPETRDNVQTSLISQ